MKKAEYPFLKNNGKIRPFIPVLVINPDTGQQFKVNALIDTGADTCAFPRVVADATGHNLKGEGVVSDVNGGIGGVKVNTWKHSFCVCLLDKTGKRILKTSKRLLISCFEHNSAPPLLGGNDFLIDLEVTFDYKNETIVIKWD